MNNTVNIKPVTIIGAGPGAFELLTIKAWDIIQRADVLLYDDLAGDEIIEKLPHTIEKIYAGKRFGDKQSQKKRLEFIKEEYLKAFNNNKKIVRLKGGDPMVFARSAEEIEFLKQEKIEFELIPGITSGLAAANAYAIPLTVREKIRNLVFTTVSLVDESNSQFSEIKNLLKMDSAVLVYMGINQLKKLLEYLTENNINNLAVHVISNISLANQKIITGDIAEILHNFEHKNFETPSIIILNKH